MPLLIVSATLLNSFKIRDVTLVSLSSQPQNFNFCNFFFKISEMKSFSDFCRKRFLYHTQLPESTVYQFLPLRQHPFWGNLKIIVFINRIALPRLPGSRSR